MWIANHLQVDLTCKRPVFLHTFAPHSCANGKDTSRTSDSHLKVWEAEASGWAGAPQVSLLLRHLQLFIFLLFLNDLLLLFQEGDQFLPQRPHLQPQAAQLAKQLDIHSAEVPLLLAVKSEPGRFAERQAVRETWGGPAAGIRLLFLLGSPVGEGGPDLRPLVAWESRRYSDLLLWDFLDVPFNQTLKDLLLLSWLGHHCPGVSFVLLAQDDAFVHTPALLQYLQALPRSWAPGLYLGEVFTQAKPLRKPGGPFYVPRSFFEGDYPAYASGGGYVIAGRLVPWLLQAVARVAPFPFNDVYIGLCFRALGLVPRAHKGFLTAWPADRTADPCALRDLLLVRPLSPQDSIRLWKHLQDPQLHC